MSLIALVVARATTLAYPELLPELIERLQQRGQRVLLNIIAHEGDADEAIAGLADVPLSGLIAAALPSAETIRSVRARGMPLLLYNCHAPLVDSVSCDHAACGRLLAQMLLDGGHRRFGIITGSGDSLVSIERALGATETLDDRRVLSLEVAEGDYSYASGVAAIDSLFQRMKPKPSAIIAVNDAMAVGALDRARALQVRIPRDLSIVGIDGTGLARLPVYDLATVRQPVGRMAAAAAEVLIARIERPDRPAEARLFGGELIAGHTARFNRPWRVPREAADVSPDTAATPAPRRSRRARAGA